MPWDAKKYGENLSPNLFAIFSRISKNRNPKAVRLKTRPPLHAKET